MYHTKTSLWSAYIFSRSLNQRWLVFLCPINPHAPRSITLRYLLQSHFQSLKPILESRCLQFWLILHQLQLLNQLDHLHRFLFQRQVLNLSKQWFGRLESSKFDPIHFQLWVRQRICQVLWTLSGKRWPIDLLDQTMKLRTGCRLTHSWLLSIDWFKKWIETMRLLAGTLSRPRRKLLWV